MQAYGLQPVGWDGATRNPSFSAQRLQIPHHPSPCQHNAVNIGVDMNIFLPSRKKLGLASQPTGCNLFQLTGYNFNSYIP